MSYVAGHTVSHVAGAFLAMGGWAVFVNHAHPMPEPLLAGLVQGTLSALITLSIKKSIEALAAWFHFRGLRAAALCLPPILVCSVSLTALTLSHLIAGTPEILPTIALPFSVSFIYACLYSFGIWQQRNRQDVTN